MSNVTAHASQDFKDLREYSTHNNRMMPQLWMLRCHMNEPHIQEKPFIRADETAYFGIEPKEGKVNEGG